MFKLLFVVLAAVLGVALCNPNPDPKPGYLAYSSPLIKTYPGYSAYSGYLGGSPLYRSSNYYGNYYGNNYAYANGYGYAAPYQYYY